MKCRHRRTWLFSNNTYEPAYEWCYECGAIRHLYDDGMTLSPATPWQKPVGKGAPNPADEFERRRKAWAKRRQS